MLHRVYMLPLVCAAFMLTIPQQTFGSTTADNGFSISRTIAGGAIGGAIGYLTSLLSKGAIVEENEKKQKFLEDLQAYIADPNYIADKNNDRLFSHYYNGLTQLIQITPESNLAYLEELSKCSDPVAQTILLEKLKAFAASIQKSHEKTLFYSKMVPIVFWGLLGAIIGATSHQSHSSHDHTSHSHTSFVPIFTGGRSSGGNIFRPC